MQYATSAFAADCTEPCPHWTGTFEAALLPPQLATVTTTNAGPREERPAAKVVTLAAPLAVPAEGSGTGLSQV
jgi:hypothetical protein